MYLVVVGLVERERESGEKMQASDDVGENSNNDNNNNNNDNNTAVLIIYSANGILEA